MVIGLGQKVWKANTTRQLLDIGEVTRLLLAMEQIKLADDKITKSVCASKMMLYQWLRSYIADFIDHPSSKHSWMEMTYILVCYSQQLRGWKAKTSLPAMAEIEKMILTCHDGSSDSVPISGALEGRQWVEAIHEGWASEIHDISFVLQKSSMCSPQLLKKLEQYFLSDLYDVGGSEEGRKVSNIYKLVCVFKELDHKSEVMSRLVGWLENNAGALVGTSEIKPLVRTCAELNTFGLLRPQLCTVLTENVFAVGLQKLNIHELGIFVKMFPSLNLSKEALLRVEEHLLAYTPTKPSSVAVVADILYNLKSHLNIGRLLSNYGYTFLWEANQRSADAKHYEASYILKILSLYCGDDEKVTEKYVQLLASIPVEHISATVTVEAVVILLHISRLRDLKGSEALLVKLQKSIARSSLKHMDRATLNKLVVGLYHHGRIDKELDVALEKELLERVYTLKQREERQERVQRGALVGDIRG
jgi:hypothetical protein